MAEIKQLIIRVSLDVSETDYGAGMAHQSTKIRMGEDGELLIPQELVSESARVMLRNAFAMPVVADAYDRLMKGLAEKAKADSDGEGA